MKSLRQIASQYQLDIATALSMLAARGIVIENNDDELDEETERQVDEILGAESRIFGDEKIILNPQLYSIEPPPPLKSNGKGCLFVFLGIILLIILLCLLPFFGLNNSDSSQASSSGAAVNSSAQLQDPSTAFAYSWSDGRNLWDYSLTISDSLYRQYKRYDRTDCRYDYAKFVEDTDASPYLTDIVSTFRQNAVSVGYSNEELASMLITFVQSLEFIAEDGVDSDEYPKFPIETLYDGGGDCEDTAILLVSLLKSCGFDAVLIQFQNHMGVGIRDNSRYFGTYYMLNTTKYYYIETTATGWSIGDLPPQFQEETATILPCR